MRFSPESENQRRITWVNPGVFFAVLLGTLFWSSGVFAQNPDPADNPAAAPADSTSLESEAGVGRGLLEGQSAAEMAASMNANSQSVSLDSQPGLPFFSTFDNVFKAGTKTDVRANKYYGSWEAGLGMAKGSKFTNTLSYSWDEFRQQDKTVQSRGEKVLYTAGNLLPIKLSANGSWDWSEDKTVNSAGIANLSKRDFKTGSIRMSKPKFDLGGFKTVLGSSVGLNDQKLINRDQRNNFKEAYLDGGAQVGTELATGITVASRLYGKSVSGDRTLGDSTSPSSANGDTLGLGMYYDRTFATGRLEISRSNFDKKYLDYKRNSTGQIDTVGLDEFDKVIDELESKDAVSIEFENEFNLGRLGLKTALSRDTDELAYNASGVGSKDKQSDKARFDLTFGVGRDSFAISYSFLWKWDDQRIKNATENRGRQYNKNRDVDFFYGRRLFKDTDLSVKYHQGLSQDIAQKQFNINDKDRLRNDVLVEMDRDWPSKFKAKVLFAYKQSEDISIRSTRSSNNNIKDSYEISPGYTWPISDWLSVSQSYRVYIQYTDYVYSDLESVNREDDYSKRGNLNTIVVLNPTERLELAVRHDFNRRSSAVRVLQDASGSSYYSTEQEQDINKIDLGVVFEMVDGVTLEAATFRTRDFKTSFGATNRESEVFSGQMWVGAKVNRSWGTDNPLELSALIKKFNAFGPSVTEASRDYWETDIWLKWEF